VTGSRRAPLAVMGAVLLLLAGCGDMSSQPKESAYSPLASPAEVPPGTVEFEAHAVAPPPVTVALLERGQSRYRVFCAPCHGESGDGRGMIVQRGFPEPPSFALERLRRAPTQHLVDVMTRGYGAMYSFAQRIPIEDRWAIAAYIRALQHSDSARVADLTPELRRRSK
jgi:mono/diheme cytochrome c family protein